MKKLFYIFLLLPLILSCGGENKTPQSTPLSSGVWRGYLTLNDSTGLILPFNFDLTIKGDSTIIAIHNAEETIIVNEVSFVQDSVFIKMPLFDSEFRCKFSSDSLIGIWINHSRTEKNIIPFTAIKGETQRFDCPEYASTVSFDGKWECVFGPAEPDSSMAIGIFKTAGGRATGTFLTETGDYRYLEGCAFGKYMLLSCFDGSHAFVFHAEVLEDSTIWGEFYSGIHFQQTWLAKKNNSFQLRNADSLTFLKTGFSKIDFTFPNLNNQKVSLLDEKFKNKVTVLQIFGSWCPNCMDETMFLADYSKKYKSKGVEVVGIAFEKTDDFEKAKQNVSRLKNKFGADYEFLISGFQPKDAEKALPQLSHIMSFPTTIFIDKKGVVRKIRTGYSGPATGEAYSVFVKEMNYFTEMLITE